MPSLVIQLMTGILLSLWSFLAALPHHIADGYTFHTMLRVLTRLLKMLGDL